MRCVTLKWLATLILGTTGKNAKGCIFAVFWSPWRFIEVKESSGSKGGNEVFHPIVLGLLQGLCRVRHHHLRQALQRKAPSNLQVLWHYDVLWCLGFFFYAFGSHRLAAKISRCTVFFFGERFGIWSQLANGVYHGYAVVSFYRPELGQPASWLRMTSIQLAVGPGAFRKSCTKSLMRSPTSETWARPGKQTEVCWDRLRNTGTQVCHDTLKSDGWGQRLDQRLHHYTSFYCPVPQMLEKSKPETML